MIRSMLMGAVAGARSMTPLAAVAVAANRGELPADNGAPALLSHPLVAAGAMAMAVGEIAGDKMKTAPDRIVLAGLAARVVTAGVAGMALAPRSQRVPAAVLSVATAVVASYVTFSGRMKALHRYGQTPSGAVEDGLVLAAATAIVRA